MVPKARKCFGRPFRTENGVTPGDSVSSKIFNIVVDTVVRAVLLDVCGPQEKHHGFGWSAGEHCIVFYADDGQIAGRNPIWLQMTMTTMVRMFMRVLLQTNRGNTKGLVCNPGLIWG